MLYTQLRYIQQTRQTRQIMPSILKIKHPEVKVCEIMNDECICKTCNYDCCECTDCIKGVGGRRTEGNKSCNTSWNKYRKYEYKGLA